MKVYKIRDPKTGLFKKAGAFPEWSKHGKVWISSGALRCHLRNAEPGYHSWKRQLDPNWEICEYDSEPSAVFKLRDFFDAKKA